MQRWARTLETVQTLQQKLRDYALLLDDARDLSGNPPDGMPHGTQVGNPTEQRAMAAIALEQAYGGYAAFLERELGSTLSNEILVEEALGRSPAVCRDICTLRYKEGKPWEQVSAKVSYSVSYCKRLHARVLQDIEKRIPKDTNDLL